MTVYDFGALPFLLSLTAVLIFGGPVIAALAKRKQRQPISGDAPAAHQSKAGTPTMGGLLILGGTMLAIALTVLLTTAAYGAIFTPSRILRLIAVLGTFLFAGLIGILDDLGKTRKKENKAGLSERAKLALQILVSAGFLVLLRLSSGDAAAQTTITLGGHTFQLGLFYYILALLFLVCFGNAANFTDGLDGLLSGITVIVSATLGLMLTFGASHGEMAVFYGALAGACAGFLCFNAFPARVFMGDTGSLAIGMGLAAAALSAKQEILLIIVGLVYVAEIASMMIQRYVFKYRRIRFGIDYAKANRVFRRAPLHHHFEELGWRETQVVSRFWVAGMVAAALGMILIPFVSERPVPRIGASNVSPADSAAPTGQGIQP